MAGARDGAGAEVCELGFSPGASPVSRANGLAHLNVCRVCSFRASRGAPTSHATEHSS